MTHPRCPICGAPFQTCGPHTDVTPVGVVREAVKGDLMQLDIYDVVVNGMPTTMRLTPQQAKRLGAVKAGTGDVAAQTQTKRRKPSNKSA